MENLPLIGIRVRLIRDVERYPHFAVSAGNTGVVTSVDDETFCVRMDAHVLGAEDWDNEVVWSIRDGDDPMADIEVMDDSDDPDAESAQQDRDYEVASADVVLPLTRVQFDMLVAAVEVAYDGYSEDDMAFSVEVVESLWTLMHRPVTDFAR